MEIPREDSPETLPLTVGISTRALFELEGENRVFETEGVEAYAKLQRERENIPPSPGAAFPIVQRLLALNSLNAPRLVEVVFLSKNSPDLSIRAFKATAAHGLKIERGSFTGGRSVVPYLRAWKIDLFLSNNDDDVSAAAEAHFAAGRLAGPPDHSAEPNDDEVRIAFDGDAVLFTPASDQIFKELGLAAFLEHEQKNADIPLDFGPHAKFLRKLSKLWKAVERGDGTSRVRIALVTARNAPAHERVIRTFREWGTPVDEAHFVGREEKAEFLRAFKADIFFDDQMKHVTGAALHVPAALVPGPHDPDKPVIPASRS